MLLDSTPPNSIYKDIKKIINEMTLRQFMKMKDKFAEDDYKAYGIATLDFNDFFLF